MCFFFFNFYLDGSKAICRQGFHFSNSLQFFAEAIVQNGKIATPAAPVWKELSQQLENKMSAKALYTFVKLNRHNIWSALEITDQESNLESNSEGELDSRCISPGQENCQAFELEVPFEDWVKFIPEKVKYNDKFSPSQKKGIHNFEAWHLDSYHQ